MTARNNKEHLKQRLKQIHARRIQISKDLAYLESFAEILEENGVYNDHQKRFASTWVEKVKKGYELTFNDKQALAEFISYEVRFKNFERDIEERCNKWNQSKKTLGLLFLLSLFLLSLFLL